MKMKFICFVLICLMAGLFGIPAHAQNYTAVTASNIQDTLGRLLSSGSICFIGTDPNNLPISFEAGGGGQVIRSGTLGCTAVSNGAIVGSLSVPNPRHTQPQGIFYHLLVMQGSRAVIDYPLVQFEGASFNFDLYAPGAPAPVPWTGGSVSGNLGVNGDLSVTGNSTLANATCSGVCTGFGGSGGGGTNAQSGTTYTAVSGDAGKNIPFTNASASTLTLPASAPSATWYIAVQSVGAGGLTINRNGRTIDGAASNLSLTQNQGVFIYADGTNYFTMRGMGSGGGGAVSSVFTRTGAVVAAANDYNFNQLAGSAACGQLPALTGDVTSSAGTCATSVASGGVPLGVYKTGLMAEYRILPGETAASLVDYSGNGNTATGTAGSGCTVVAVTGGLSCGGTGGVTLPSGLNSAVTIQVEMGYQPSQVTASGISAPVIGNGAAAACPTASTSGIGIGVWQPSNLKVSIGTLVNNFLASGSPLYDWTQDGFSGVGDVAVVLSNTADVLYINGTAVGVSQTQTGQGLGKQTTGAYQLAGGAAAVGYCSSTYFPGTVYYALFYSGALNAAQIYQNHVVMQNAMQARGVIPSVYRTDTADMVIGAGDSITHGTGSVSGWPDVTVGLNGTPNIQNRGISGINASNLNNLSILIDDPNYSTGGGKSAVLMMTGANDSVPQTIYGGLRSWSIARRNVGWFPIVSTMIDQQCSGSVGDNLKNNTNAIIRANWRSFAPAFVDLGEASALGANAASQNTTYYQVDCLHLTQTGVTNVQTWMNQRAVNFAYGNTDFSTANIYASPAASAVAVSNATESGNTMTFTTAANTFTKGQCITVSGVTPTSYNSTFANGAGLGCWYALTVPNNTTFTATSPSTGLAALSVAGTAVAPQQVDADQYIMLNFGTGNFTLEPCDGLTGQDLYIKNINGSSSTIVPFGTQTIDGSSTLTITSGSTRILQAVLVSASAGGCNWRTLQ